MVARSTPGVGQSEAATSEADPSNGKMRDPTETYERNSRITGYPDIGPSNGENSPMYSSTLALLIFRGCGRIAANPETAPFQEALTAYARRRPPP